MEEGTEYSVTYKLKLNGGDIKAVQGDSGHFLRNTEGTYRKNNGNKLLKFLIDDILFPKGAIT